MDINIGFIWNSFNWHDWTGSVQISVTGLCHPRSGALAVFPIILQLGALVGWYILPSAPYSMCLSSPIAQSTLCISSGYVFLSFSRWACCHLPGYSYHQFVWWLWVISSKVGPLTNHQLPISAGKCAPMFFLAALPEQWLIAVRVGFVSSIVIPHLYIIVPQITNTLQLLSGPDQLDMLTVTLISGCSHVSQEVSWFTCCGTWHDIPMCTFHYCRSTMVACSPLELPAACILYWLIHFTMLCFCTCWMLICPCMSQDESGTVISPSKDHYSGRG